MKHLAYYLTLLLLVIGGGIMQSCKDDDQEAPPAPDPEGTLTAGTIGTNSVDLKVQATNMTDYAYQVTTNLSAAAPSAAILFGTGTTGKLQDGENIITITGLEGNTDYKVHLATKSDKGFGKVLSVQVKTASYTEFVTITEYHYNGISFHIEVPEGKTVAWACLDRDWYIGAKQQFGYVDATWLTNASDEYILTKSATVTYTEYTDPETGETYSPFAPGQAITLLVGEVEKGPDPWDPEKEVWMPKFDFEKYNQEGGGGGPLAEDAPVTEDECWTTDLHRSMLINTKAPTNTDAPVKIEVLNSTTLSVTFRLTPDEKLLAYAYMYIDMATWETLTSAFGEEGALYWATSNSNVATEPTEVKISGLQEGITYKLVVIGKANEDGTLRSVTMKDFQTIEPTKPAPVVVVTGIDAPSGEQASPYLVWFNVKAPNRDVVTAKYLCNSVGEWTKSLNSGNTYVAMMNQYGQPLDNDAVAAINSASGFNISFASWEDSENRLAVCGYNDEETCNSPDKDDRGWADKRTMEEPALPAVSSSLFDDLSGEWTATVTRFVSTYDAATGKYIEKEETTPKVTKVTISQTLDYPATCPEEVYKVYPKLTKEQVDELYDGFLQSTAKYNRKVKGQNRLICQGLDIAGTSMYTKFMSPYGLFINTTYNAYDNDELFHTWGPKWYLQIGENDQVIVPTDLSRIPPVTAWYYETLYLTGISSDGYDPTMKSFSVTVSDDKQTMTIQPNIVNNVTYYPSLISITAGQAISQAKCSKFVLTKGTAKASSVSNNRNLASVSVPALADFKPAKISHRTRLNTAKPIIYKKATAKPVSFKEIQKAKLEKLNIRRPVRR